MNRPMGGYRYDHETDYRDPNQLGALPAIAISAGVSLAKDAVEAAKKEAERRAANLAWYQLALNGDLTALARLHVMGGQGTQQDRQTILAGEGKDIGPGPWGWASTDAQKDAIAKYNDASLKLGVKAPSGPNIDTLAKVAPIGIAVVGGVVMLMLLSGRRNRA